MISFDKALALVKKLGVIEIHDGHRGTGGSARGPRLVWDALRPLDPTIDLRVGDQFLPLPNFNAADARVTAEAVFVGQAIHAPELGHDDFAGRMISKTGRYKIFSIIGASTSASRRMKLSAVERFSVQTIDDRSPFSGSSAKGPDGRKCSTARPPCGLSWRIVPTMALWS